MTYSVNTLSNVLFCYLPDCEVSSSLYLWVEATNVCPLNCYYGLGCCYVVLIYDDMHDYTICMIYYDMHDYMFSVICFICCICQHSTVWVKASLLYA